MSKDFVKKVFLPAGVIALFFAACGDSGGGKDALTPEEGGVETIEDLPNCSKTREGNSVFVIEDSLTYTCQEGRWRRGNIQNETENDDDDSDTPTDGKSPLSSPINSVESLDDLPNCSKTREGKSVFVAEDSVTYICRSGQWEEKKYLIDSVDIEDDLPNCTQKLLSVETISTADSALYECDGERWQKMATTYSSSEDLPNCTEKREGNRAFLLDTREKVQCAGKRWESVEEWSDAPESSSTLSSSSKGSSASSSHIEYGTLTDLRDGQTYRTVVIGTQTWMAENLNYDDGHGVCPMKEAENCEKYGRLYSFTEGDSSSKSDICPTGWRMPDSLDYAELIAYVSKNNGGEPVGVSLKATTGWISAGETIIIEGDGTAHGSVDSTRVGASRGTDRFGFAALPAGSCWGKQCYVGDDTRFIFSTPWYGNGSYKLAFDKDSLIYDEDGGFGYISVRCLKGEASSSTVSSTSSSSVGTSSSSIEYGYLTDSRDGKTYKTVTIGTQTWMAENLNYETENSYCYNDTATYCDKYGRLYTWAAAMDSVGSWSTNGKGCGYNKECSPTYPVRGACPQGWHLPTRSEFSTLFDAVGGWSTAGTKLKTTSGWYSGSTGTDDFGFSALPAGHRETYGGFYELVYNSYFWCGTETSDNLAYYSYLYYGESADLKDKYKNYALSVRCLKN